MTEDEQGTPAFGETSIYPELLAIPASTAPIGKDSTDPEASYYAVVIDDSDLLTRAVTLNFPFVRPQKSFFVTGDHVYVYRINGSGTWSIQLGSDKNPLIRLREGMVLRRKYTKVTVSLQDGRIDSGFYYAISQGNIQPTRIELLLSTGPLILQSPDPRKGFGMKSLGLTDQVASTTRQFFCYGFDPTTGAWQGFDTLKPGFDGATLLIRNSDLVNTLFIGTSAMTQPPPSNIGTQTLWRLYPGESMTIELDGMIVDYQSGAGLTVFTQSGTCNFDWWLSRYAADRPILPNFFFTSGDATTPTPY